MSEMGVGIAQPRSLDVNLDAKSDLAVRPREDAVQISLSRPGHGEAVQKSVSDPVEKGRRRRERSDMRRHVREPSREGARGVRAGRSG